MDLLEHVVSGRTHPLLWIEASLGHSDWALVAMLASRRTKGTPRRNLLLGLLTPSLFVTRISSFLRFCLMDLISYTRASEEYVFLPGGRWALVLESSLQAALVSSTLKAPVQRGVISFIVLV